MGKTIVISSHILTDLEEICSDIAIIEHGTVAWQGNREQMNQAAANEGAHLEVEVAATSIDAARELFAEIDAVKSSSGDNGTLILELRGNDSNAVLRTLIDADIQVLHFSRRGSGLEQLFLSHTKGLGN